MRPDAKASGYLIVARLEAQVPFGNDRKRKASAKAKAEGTSANGEGVKYFAFREG
jgi:hypothetical protein